MLWDTTPARLDLERDAWFLMGWVLEFGTMRDVRWLKRVYGDERIHEFFREAADPELSSPCGGCTFVQKRSGGEALPPSGEAARNLVRSPGGGLPSRRSSNVSRDG